MPSFTNKAMMAVYAAFAIFVAIVGYHYGFIETETFRDMDSDLVVKGKDYQILVRRWLVRYETCIDPSFFKQEANDLTEHLYDESGALEKLLMEGGKLQIGKKKIFYSRPQRHFS